jgi:arylsulfatase A-like enzyme
MKSLLLTLTALLLAPVVTLYAADPARPAKPNIDALAASGVRCTDGCVSAPYCSPLRAGSLTGWYQTRFGHEFNPHARAAVVVEEEEQDPTAPDPKQQP